MHLEGSQQGVLPGHFGGLLGQWDNDRQQEDCMGVMDSDGTSGVGHDCDSGNGCGVADNDVIVGNDCDGDSGDGRDCDSGNGHEDVTVVTNVTLVL